MNPRPERMFLRYRSGEEILEGDRVLFHRNAAEVLLVARESGNPESDWYMRQFGGGVLISDPAASGRTFIPADQIEDYEDLVFVSRAPKD